MKQKDAHSPEMPVLAVKREVDEEAILDAMQHGAVDMVSMQNRERLQVVVSRELRALRVERALNSTLQSATTYRKQLYDYMEGSSSAIAYVQEGIVTKRQSCMACTVWPAEEGRCHRHAPDGQLRKRKPGGRKRRDHRNHETEVAGRRSIERQSKNREFESRVARTQFQLAEFDDGNHIQIRIAPPVRQPEEPTKLVHDALKRDPTTLFFHRVQFLERITKRLARKPASGLHVLVYIKPDEFTAVAKKVGLIASEDVLAQFAEAVRKRLHPRDVARTPSKARRSWRSWNAATNRDAEVWAQQLIDHIQATPFTIDKRSVSVTCTRRRLRRQRRVRQHG